MHFLHPASAFMVIALWASCDNVGPDMLTAHVARDDVIDGQTAITFATILAGIIIPSEHFTSG
jgi:hypothetical protein